MNSEVYSLRDINEAISGLTEQLSSLLSNVKSDVLVSQSDKVLMHTRYQFIFNLKLKSTLESKILEVILSHAIAAEKLGPGAFDVTIERLLEYFGQFQRVYSKPNSRIIETTASRRANENDIDELVINKVKNVDVLAGSLLKEALNLAGFGGRIIVEKTHVQMPSVELSRGYSFDVNPAFSTSIKLDSPRVFVIDGYIERVSEIHHLLEAASDSKESALMFVRGLSDDVLHTLRINYDRGTVRIIPIIVKFDIDGINTVNDISVVCGCDMVSSNKGDLISSIKFENAPRIRSAILYPGKVVIQHDTTSKNVSSHVSELRKKRTEPHVIEDVGRLYDKRIRSLSPSHVVIRIPETKDYVRQAQSIDVALRTIKSIVDHGVLIHNGTLMPTSAKIAAEIHSSRCHETLTSLGAVLWLL